MPKKLLVLIVAALLALTVGACGAPEEGNSGKGSSGGQAAAEPDKPTAVESVQVAYRETAAEQTAKTAFEMTMTAPSADPETPSQPVPMTMTMSGEGAVDFSGEASILSIRMDGMGTMEVRQVGNTVYTKMPEGFVAQMPEAKPWARMDLDKMYGQSGGALGQMQGGAASDPTRQLGYLRGVSDSVKKVGTDTVRGAETTRYRATIETRKLVEELDGETRKKYEEAMRQTGMEEMPVEIWLDDQNRVRRYAMDVKMDMPENEMPGSASGAPQGGEMRMQMVSEYFDFGTTVDVQAPPRDQTMDGSGFMPAQQSTVAQ